MDGSVLLHHDENESETNPDDILVRRLKNRERQRRYRARKRHEADRRNLKASHVDQSTPPLHYQEMMPSDLLSVPVEVEISVNLTSTDRVTRVHCPRDWKRDARGAHIIKKREPGPVGPSNSGAGTLTETFSECEGKSDNNATHLSQLSRRDWKAEARNKKSLE